MDFVFDADLTVGVYKPDEGNTEKPILIAVRLQKAGNPIQLEFTSGDAVLLEGMAQTFLEVAAAQRQWAANAPLLGTAQNEVGATAPNSPAEAGEGNE